jgi:hypothetical protein
MGAVPKLHVITVHHPLGSLLGGLIIDAQELMPLPYVAIPANDKGSIVLQLGRSQPLRSYVSRFRLGWLCAKPSLVEGRVEAI